MIDILLRIPVEGYTLLGKPVGPESFWRTQYVWPAVLPVIDSAFYGFLWECQPEVHVGEKPGMFSVIYDVTHPSAVWFEYAAVRDLVGLLYAWYGVDSLAAVRLDSADLTNIVISFCLEPRDYVITPEWIEALRSWASQDAQ